MKILLALPGHLKTVPMGKFCIDALGELGYEVAVFDYHPTPLDRLSDRVTALTGKAPREEKPATNRRFRQAVEQAQPDLMVTLFGFDLSPQSLAYLQQKGIPSVCWWINDPFQYQRSLAKADHYDFLFSNSAVCAEQYRAAGINNAFFLPTACQPEVHHPAEAVEHYASDICFAGDWSPLREKFLLQLAERFDVKIFGPWQKKLAPDSPLQRHLVDGFFSPQEMAQMFSSAKVVLNIHTWYETHDHGLNPRLFEAAGCGAFQVADWKQEIPSLFDPDREMFCYRTPDDLVAALERFVADDETRQTMAQAAQRRALGEHTYRHRMETMLETVRRHG